MLLAVDVNKSEIPVGSHLCYNETMLNEITIFEDLLYSGQVHISLGLFVCLVSYQQFLKFMIFFIRKIISTSKKVKEKNHS